MLTKSGSAAPNSANRSARGGDGSHASRTLSRSNFNGFRDESGTWHQDFEELPSTHVDSPAGEGFKALRDGDFPLAPDQRDGVASFIAAQLTRGRQFHAQTDRFMRRLTTHITARAMTGPIDEITPLVAARTWTLVTFDQPCLHERGARDALERRRLGPRPRSSPRA